MDNIKIRKAKLSDIDVLSYFQDQLVDAERPFDDKIRKGKVEYYDLRKMIESEKVNFLLVESDNKIIGCGFGEIRKNDNWYTNEHIGYIGLVFVDKNHRNKGLSGMIIKTLLDWFKEKKIVDIRLKVYEKNIAALNAYKKYGFEGFMVEMKKEI